MRSGAGAAGAVCALTAVPVDLYCAGRAAGRGGTEIPARVEPKILCGADVAARVRQALFGGPTPALGRLAWWSWGATSGPSPAAPLGGAARRRSRNAYTLAYGSGLED